MKLQGVGPLASINKINMKGETPQKAVALKKPRKRTLNTLVHLHIANNYMADNEQMRLRKY